MDIINRKRGNNNEPLRKELYNSEQLAHHAETLAKQHRIKNGGKGNRLLYRLHHNNTALRDYNQQTLVLKKPRQLVPASQELIDNYYLIEEHIQLARSHFPKKYSRELPSLCNGPFKELPRVYAIIFEYISHVDAQIDESSLRSFIRLYQGGAQLTLGELWAIPIMLRLSLIENLQRIATRLDEEQLHRDAARTWIERLRETATEKQSGIIKVIADMSTSDIPLSNAFLSEFCQGLSVQNPLLYSVRTWLEERLHEEGLSIEESMQAESQAQAADQLSVSHSIGSLRALAAIDWETFVEELSVVESVLQTDPANIYSSMDFATRDHYRHQIEAIAKHSSFSEQQVAEKAVALATEIHRDKPGDRQSHVGYYLVNDGYKTLYKLMGGKKPFSVAIEYAISLFPFLFYVGGIILLTIIAVGVHLFLLNSNGISPFDWRAILVSLIFLLCVSQLAVDMINWLSVLLVKPRILPRLDFSKGIPSTCCTMVVIPTIIADNKGVDKLIEQLELHYLSNTDPHLHFALLTDFADAAGECMPEDKKILDRTMAGIEQLNKQYNGNRNGSVFYLFHRPRKWNPGEKSWIGHERKRGKLMDFTGVLRNGSTDCFSHIIGSRSVLPSIKYVITLDTDTQLPGDSANKLIGAMSHLLNRPVYDEKKNIVSRGYGILQPRVEINLASSRRSAFTRLFSGDAGIDPYTRAISDVYQDVFHEGSFIGKGIYDVDAFLKVLDNRFPDNKILSHDLLESTYLRSALISDVQLYEAYPSGYNSEAARRHRWVRGDWQLIQWLFPNVPTGNDKKKERNPISRLGWWKLADNLRRSLIPPAILLFLILSYLLFPHAMLLGPLLVLAIFLLPLLLNFVNNLLRWTEGQSWILRQKDNARTLARQFRQVMLSLALLPYEAFQNSRAIVVTLWRLCFSHRHLMQWKTFSSTEQVQKNTIPNFYRNMWSAPAFATLCALLMYYAHPILFWWALPVCIIWALAPLIAWHISRPIVRTAPRFSQEQTLLLRRIARKTWAFFETFVTADENWLPPDNFQEVPQPTVASRTSPTNIGLSLLANLSACDFGYLTPGKLLERSQHTFDTIAQLQKFKGHLYNWYDTRTLEPLFPLYISSVDSGNLAGHLLTFGQGVQELIDTPVCHPEIFRGLQDTIIVMKEYAPIYTSLTMELESILSAPPQSISKSIIMLRNLSEKIQNQTASFNTDNDALYTWNQTLLRNTEELTEELLWLSPGSDNHLFIPENAADLLPEQLIAELQKQDTGMTLRELSRLEQTLCPLLEAALIGQAELEDCPEKAEMQHYLTSRLQHTHIASARATERIRAIFLLSKQSDELASRMDFTFLYDPAKKLFTIGYNVQEQRNDNSSYDLLASEARLGSYVAIALGQVPQEHWFSLGRLLILSHGDPVLLSWSGSMFEYLMPLLVMPDYEHTLLSQTYQGAVREQIDYGKTLGVPWGISESGYNRTDTRLNYQYKAFGVPNLGLKRGLSETLVITPYATVMALMVAPEKACENMQRLTHGGHEGFFGYYEAIDYTPSHLRPGQSSVDIHSFMAHHQGMSLLSLGNLINGNAMQRRFMSCPRLRACELLMQERIPHHVTVNVLSDDSEYELEGVHPLLSDDESSTRRFRRMDITPEVNLLSNGRYHVMVNHAGAGYSRFHKTDVTRWREDATSDNLGMFVYWQDTESDEFGSVTHQPVVQKNAYNEAIFTQAFAEFRQHQSGIQIHTTVCVSPEDDMEVRRIELTNRTSKSRTIELTTYCEAIIAAAGSDEAHPAFSNLFVQTQFLSGSSAVLATRRPRSEGEEPLHLFHILLVEEDQQEIITCETDRAAFIGRGRALSAPLAMNNMGALSGTTGSVLDPAVSLRRKLTVKPGQKVTACAILGVAATHQSALDIVGKYQHIRITERAFEMAWTHSRVVLTQLGVTEAEAQTYNKLAGALVYANPERRAPKALLKTNRRGQDGLWSYSISGDIPIVLVRISEAKGLELVRQLVLAHAYWRMKGLPVELVILNEDASVYRQTVHEEIVNLIASGIEAPSLEKAEGIFVRRIEQVPQEDMVLLQASACIVLSDEFGPLSKQLQKLDFGETQVPLLKPARSHVTAIKNQLLRRKLLFDNGTGGFSADGQEYIITLHPGQTTPAPWCNVLANENFGTVVSERGGAYTWAVNAHEFRLTPWNNDPVKDHSGEAFYIRDEETGQFWSPTPSPTGGKTPYVIRHGFGYTVFEHSENGVDSEFTLYVATDASVKFGMLKLRNTTGKARKITVTGYYEWVLGDQRAKNLLHIQTEIDVNTGALFARNFYNTEFAGQIAFIDVHEPRTVTGNRTEFIGRNGSLANPAAMQRTRLSGKTGAGFDPCGAIQLALNLPEGQEKSVCFRLGHAANKNEMRGLVARFRQPGACEAALHQVRDYWKRTLSTIEIDSPDASVNVMGNGWLLYQTLACRIWGRSGYYQSGGAYGFRDQLQDVMALMHAEPGIARQQILRAAGRQFVEGDVQHWWHPPTGRGVRTHFSDDYLWLPYVVSKYVNDTDDTGILDERVSFIDGRPLRADEESYYDLPGWSPESASLYVHCVKSIRYGLKFGEHGLPLMGCGDWNDGMNLVGIEGRGESVWLAFFLYDALKKFSGTAVLYNDPDFSQYCLDQAETLRLNIRKYTWDGEWYLRAYFDNGQPLGTKANKECRIDSLPQSWAVISGAGEPPRFAEAMKQVDQQLISREHKLVRLFTLPFDTSAQYPGYIKGYIPGVRENGGQYTHAAIWTAMAFALMGETEKAWELFGMLNPVRHGDSSEEMAVYKVEPYVVAADVYASAQHPGRGGWTWYTGSSAWMYRLLTETLLGINRKGNTLQLKPRLPKEWESCRVRYRYKNSVYYITFAQTAGQGENTLMLDGHLQETHNILLMIDDGQEHVVEMRVSK